MALKADHWIQLFGSVGMAREPLYSPPPKLHRRKWDKMGWHLTWVSKCGRTLDASVNLANYRNRSYSLCRHCFPGGGYASVHPVNDWLDAYRPYQEKLDV